MSDICDRLNAALKDRETGQWLRSGLCTDATSDLVAEARDEIRKLRTENDELRRSLASAVARAIDTSEPLASRAFPSPFKL